MNIAAGDVLPAFDADAGAAPRGSSNIRHFSRMELPGGGQIVIQGKTAFVGHQVGPEGTTILDISDPRKPKVLSQIMTQHPWSHTHKVRVAGDIMLVNSEREPGKGNAREYAEGGFRIYDVKDKTNPKLITFHKTHGKGVHRFDMDENYAYLSTEMEGYVGNILVIYDIRNPSKPTEVGRWCMENQHVANGDTPHPKGTEHRLHHAMRTGNLMFAGCWMSGLSIIDVSDVTKPKTLSRYQYKPPHTEPSHTFLGLSHAIGGRKIAVSTEEERHTRGPDHGKPHGPFRTWDVTDPTQPKLLSTIELAESATPYDTNVARFGTHQLREKVDADNLVYVTWFAGGMRVMDINDPANPKERGYFIPKPGDGANAPLTNDIYMDDRGLLFITDKKRGLDVIEFKG